MQKDWLLLPAMWLALASIGWGAEPPFVPDLLIVRDGWKTSHADVRAVLEATASEFWSQTPDRKIPPIIVHPQGGPIVYFQRGPDQEYSVHLDTGERYWGQYVYQFSHELCHILCQYDRDPHGQKWFEESLCELASIDTLRRMGNNWKQTNLPKYLKDFAPHLTTYAADRIEKGQLDAEQTLARWYAVHRQELEETATNRELNTVVAVALLPLFEANPKAWRAVPYLNVATPKGPQTFVEYLSDWKQNCPEESQSVVDSIAEKFGLTLVPREAMLPLPVGRRSRGVVHKEI
ncbi:MAG: hypothetical protein R3C01_05195 [Planctomycetaceae bacterium]